MFSLDDTFADIAMFDFGIWDFWRIYEANPRPQVLRKFQGQLIGCS